jgi:hypothetical protein
VTLRQLREIDRRAGLSPFDGKVRGKYIVGGAGVLAVGPIRGTCKRTWLSLPWPSSHPRWDAHLAAGPDELQLSAAESGGLLLSGDSEAGNRVREHRSCHNHNFTERRPPASDEDVRGRYRLPCPPGSAFTASIVSAT